MRVLSLGEDKNGRIYAGGFYDFGYLETDGYGKTEFVSLVPEEIEQVDIGLIFKVLCDNENVVFASEKQLFIYENEKVEIRNLKNRLLSAFEINSTLYFFFDTKSTASKQTGLHIFKNGKFNKLSATQGLNIMDINFISPTGKKGELLIGTGSQGLFLLKNNLLQEFNSQANEFIKNNGLSCGIRTSSQQYAVGTELGGIVLFDEYGEIIQIINQSARLQDESINALFTDKNSSLWAATNNGISKN